MNYKSLLFLPLIFWGTCFAQHTQSQIIEDSIIGWQYMRKPSPLKPFTFKGHTLTIGQAEKLNTIVDWMQQTYTPVGGIGTFQRMVYVLDDSFAPHTYGIDFRVWNVSFSPKYLDAQGHFKPVDEEYTKFGVSANMITGSNPILFINKPDQYLFTWQPDGYRSPEASEERFRGMDPKIHPNVYKYITRINSLVTIYLVPGNKLPVVEVTIGEYLKLAEESLERQLERDKERFDNQWPGDDIRNKKSRDNAYALAQKSIEAFRTNILILKEKYKSSLQNQAVINNMQPTIYDFHGTEDPFTYKQAAKDLKNYYPVYKIEPAVLAKCNSDQPQWLAIYFPYETKEDGNQLYEMYRSLTEHFNYDYAYDYFFNPDKVKGKAYKPLNEELLKATLDKYRKKSHWQKRDEGNIGSSNGYYTDDFAANQIGSKPAGWFFNSYGKLSKVVTLADNPGKWVDLGYNNPIFSTGMKKPLPDNFTLECDIATGAFTSRTGGSMALYFSSLPIKPNGDEDLYGSGTILKVELRSGNEADYTTNNYMGSAKVEIRSRPPVNMDNHEEGIFSSYDLREFTNIKTKIHVGVSIKEGKLKLFINSKQVAVSSDFKMTYGKPCISCNIPAGTKFRTLYWRNITNDSENGKVYFSNVKITKD